MTRNDPAAALLPVIRLDLPPAQAKRSQEGLMEALGPN